MLASAGRGSGVPEVRRVRTKAGSALVREAPRGAGDTHGDGGVAAASLHAGEQREGLSTTGGARGGRAPDSCAGATAVSV